MKLRILCLVICIIMVLPLALTGCSSKKEEGAADEATTSTSSRAMTVTFYTITNKSTTEEAIARVEEAINDITESEFNTHVILRMTTADKYEKLINEKIEAIEEQLELEAAEAAAKKAAEKAAREAAKTATGTTTKAEETTEETSTGPETVINAYGLEEVLYPEENGTQLDILLIPDGAMLKALNKEGVLTALDEQLSIGSKILGKYIHPTFLSACKLNKKTYAIPNYHVVGEYTYMLLNKELVDKYYYDADDLKTFTDIGDYLDDMLKYEPDVVPVLNEPELLVEYPTGKESIYGSTVLLNTSLGTDASPRNLMNTRQFATAKVMINDLRKANAIADKGTPEDGKKYAACFIKGDITTPEKYEEDYYVTVYKNPTADDSNINTGAYAVSKYAADPARCMEIITYLTTNTEFVNLLAYGEKGIDYEIDEITGLVHKLNNKYSMDLAYCGNQFMLLPNDEMDEATIAYAKDEWKLAKLQNLDMSFSLYLNFELAFTEEVQEETGKFEEDGKTPIKKTVVQELVVAKDKPEQMTVKELVAGLDELTADILKRLDEFEPFEETYTEVYYVYDENMNIVQAFRESSRMVDRDEYINRLITDINDNKFYKAASNAEDANSIVGQYTKHFTSSY
ncbi:MAG: ABC transporter substrate-binding protein [Clostridiales bacterium]|nr:ABC transporter substrate-binding protein [Clostridiales bacterium]